MNMEQRTQNTYVDTAMEILYLRLSVQSFITSYFL
jgi:hypothetical protein